MVQTLLECLLYLNHIRNSVKKMDKVHTERFLCLRAVVILLLPGKNDMVIISHR